MATVRRTKSITATGNGDWILSADFAELTIEWTALEAGGVLQPYVSNQASPAADGGQALGSALNASPTGKSSLWGSGGSTDGPFHWVRFAKTAGGAATATQIEIFAVLV